MNQPAKVRMVPPLVLLALLGSWSVLVPEVQAKDKPLDVLISADAIPSPDGFRPRPGKPIRYLLVQSRDTLGQAVGGVKMPEPALVEKALVAELKKQGFERAVEGGPLPDIGIVAVVGDSNFDDAWPDDNPMLDERFRPYLDGEKGGRTMLWRTTMLIDWREDFSKALPAMLAQAGPVFGTDVAVPGYVTTDREAKVEIGEMKVVGDEKGNGSSAAKTPGK